MTRSSPEAASALRARLHAALDAVIDTEQMIAQIHDSAPSPPPAVNRLGAIVAEARVLLRELLAAAPPLAATGRGAR